MRRSSTFASTCSRRFDELNDQRWIRIIPAAELPPVALVSLSFDGATAATFTVGDGPDGEAPPAPVVDLFGPCVDGACPPMVELSVDGDAAAIASASNAPALSDGARLDGIGTGTSIVVSGEADATATVFVSAIDLAGNVSPPVEIEVTFPAQFGTGSGGENVSLVRGPVPGEAGLVAALLLVVAWRRRSS